MGAAVEVRPGTRLGVYEVVAPVDAGGMGEVYRARDLKLGREVALKVLPPAFTHDAERLARFEREARVLAALNHPHIAQIYGLEDSGGIRALVLELVEGDTLRERIGTRGLPVDEALRIAQQIADALDVAHEHGIVHRDLKPANIKVTPDGTVKVLDFGLAKIGAPGSARFGDVANSPTVSEPTVSGVVLGTVPYMSPEQARGQTVDKRADIWAFGCVLYEMLTGRRAFAGATTTDTLAAILEREPDWSALPRATPPTVRRLLARSLAKDRTLRLRDIGDARADLEDCRAPFEPPVHPQSWLAWTVAGIATLATLVLAAWSRWRAPAVLPPGGPLPSAVEQLTFDSGISTMPSISGDGRLLAYASTRSGRGDLDIWVQQTAGGPPLRITDDPADDRDPDLSPDGSQVVFRSDRGGGGAYITPALGGPARLIAPDARGPRFSPDGAAIDEPRRLLHGTAPVGYARQSRDGTVVFSQTTTERVVERTPLATADGPLSPIRLYADANPGAGRASVTRDGQVLVFERETPSAREIVKKDLRTGEQRLVLSLKLRSTVNATVSPDGARIAFTVDAGSEGRANAVGSQGFVVGVEGGVPTPVCERCAVWGFLADSQRAIVTRDEKTIGVIDIVSRQFVEWVSDGDARLNRPSVSPNDRWLAFRRLRGTAAKVYVVPATPGRTVSSAVQIDEPTTTGRPCGWSPDSQILYLLLDTDGNRCFWGQRIDPASGRPVGKPYVVRHFHDLDGIGVVSTSFGNAVTHQGFVYETLSVRSSLWKLVP